MRPLTEEEYVAAARKADQLGEVCYFSEYDPAIGRVPEHFKPRYMPFAQALVDAVLAAPSASAQAKPVEELAMMVRLLVHALRKASPANPLSARAVDYLERHGLQGSVLRAAPAPSASPSYEPKLVKGVLDDLERKGLNAATCKFCRNVENVGQLPPPQYQAGWDDAMAEKESASPAALTDEERDSASYLNMIAQPGFLHYPELKAINIFLQRVLAASPADQGGWQPIETAPKDGTLIDLWFGGEFKHRRADCYWGLPHHCCGEMGSLCDSDWHGLSEGWVDDFNQPISDFDGGPTHWMPLPSAPAMSASKEGARDE